MNSPASFKRIFNLRETIYETQRAREHNWVGCQAIVHFIFFVLVSPEEHCARIGKVYKKCSCDATCSSQGSKCQPCTEGCFCPKGKVLDKNGKCVATAKCNCIYNGKEYSVRMFIVVPQRQNDINSLDSFSVRYIFYSLF